MARKRGRPVNVSDVTRIDVACRTLVQVRDWLHASGAYHAAEYVSRALKSARGAERHARARFDRQELSRG